MTEAVEAHPAIGRLFHPTCDNYVATPGGNALYRRGETLEVTADIIDASRDRHGNSWLDDLSENAQLDRWGKIRWMEGAAPEGQTPWTLGDAEAESLHRLEREKLKRRADLDDDEMVAELRRLSEKYGRIETSWSGPKYADDREIAARRAAARAADGR